jgi:hypothetical protein
MQAVSELLGGNIRGFWRREHDLCCVDGRRHRLEAFLESEDNPRAGRSLSQHDDTTAETGVRGLWRGSSAL